MAEVGERIVVKRCAVCNVRMSKGHKKGPKPIVCSRSVCKKAWAKKHMTLDYPPTSWDTATWYNRFLKQNPDAWDDYLDNE